MTPKHLPQWLGRGDNPTRYAELIDTIGGEGWLIREQVIFPTLFRLMREKLSQDELPLIDFGAGPGSLTERLGSELNITTEGVDTSSAFVRLARSGHPHTAFRRITHETPVGYNMHHTNAHLVLHCTPEPAKLLEQMADATAPSAHAFVTVPNADYFKVDAVRERPGQDAYVVSVGEQAKMTYYPVSLTGYERLFRDAGFTIVAKEFCFAPTDSPTVLEKYRRNAHFVVYALQKKEDVIDTALITDADTGKVLLLTRSFTDDKFPGAESLFSVRRITPQTSGTQNLSAGLKNRLSLEPLHISSHTLGTLRVKHRHRTRLQHAKVNLYIVKVRNVSPDVGNRYYADGQFVSPTAIRPFGGACTQLAYEYFRARQ